MKIKSILLALAFMLSSIFAVPVYAQDRPSKAKTVHVKGYTTKKGKYVAPHKRSAPRKKK